VWCNKDENIEYDHIVPVSKGGESTESNLQLLCRSCNRKKRAQTPTQTPTQTPEIEPCPEREEETEKRESREDHAHIDGFVEKCVSTLERKHAINYRYDKKWLGYFRNDLRSLETKGVSQDRIIAALEWYEKNDYYAMVNSGRTLETHFAGIEKAMSGEEEEEIPFNMPHVSQVP
jgi:hypothetical protein